ncbi:6-phosphogluconolactonase [Demequina aestuarii]|uniref:6-phosphogluconolactonase n=1 Tax=Demequina aestuarii TaxID=327095 RepID=UPI00078277EE|nr:6-phosphogluconolactonase [Demequina aestuarii]
MTAAREVIVYADAEAVADATAARLLLSIGDTLAHRESVHVVVTGGTVGIATLAAAATSPLAKAIDWTDVHIWWGDERFVPVGHEDRNEGQAQAALLASLPLPEENIHRMGAPGQYATVEDAASAYANDYSDAGSPAFDVLMLGLGPDGHVASLFPGHPGFAASGAPTLAVHDSPKPPPTRVSLALETINGAREVWVIAAGAAKADVVARCLRGDADLPGAAVSGSDRTLWLIDAAAATSI